MSNIYSIYKATNKVNGKVYIGFDSKWPNRKCIHEQQYKSKSKNGKKHKHFYNALKKYGWDVFEWEVIFESIDGKYTLNIMEPFFVAAYDSKNNGYNLTDGGDGVIGYTFTEEQKKKVSVGLKGKPKSKEHSKKVGLVNSVSLRGRKLSDETKEKIRKSNLGKHNHSEEWIENMRRLNLGRKFSEESKMKMRLAKLGKKFSDEHKRRMSVGQILRHNREKLNISPL